LKSALFAFAGGEYSHAEIFARFGVGGSTLRKKMHALRTFMDVDRAKFEKIMIEDPSRIKYAIDTMPYPKRGNQHYLEENEIHLRGTLAQESNQAGYGKGRKEIQRLAQDVVHNVGKAMIYKGIENNNDQMIKRGNKLAAAPCSTHFMTHNIGAMKVTDNRMMLMVKECNIKRHI
jgi:hypothetical protein